MRENSWFLVFIWRTGPKKHARREACSSNAVWKFFDVDVRLIMKRSLNMERGERYRRRMYELEAIPKLYMMTGTGMLLLMGVLPGRVWRGKALELPPTARLRIKRGWSHVG